MDLKNFDNYSRHTKNSFKSSFISSNEIVTLINALGLDPKVDEINLIASQQSHELGANKIIARLRDQQYSSRESIIKPEKFGVDMVIHPEKEACKEIVQLMKYPYAVQARSFEGGRLTMVGILSLIHI